MENKSGKMYLCQGSFYICLLDPSMIHKNCGTVIHKSVRKMAEKGQVNWNGQAFRHNAGISKFSQDEVFLLFTVILKNNSLPWCFTVTYVCFLVKLVVLIL